jgi:hypothetical protein
MGMKPSLTAADARQILGAAIAAAEQNQRW